MKLNHLISRLTLAVMLSVFLSSTAYSNESLEIHTSKSSNSKWQDIYGRIVINNVNEDESGRGSGYKDTILWEVDRYNQLNNQSRLEVVTPTFIAENVKDPSIQISGFINDVDIAGIQNLCNFNSLTLIRKSDVGKEIPADTVHNNDNCRFQLDSFEVLIED